MRSYVGKDSLNLSLPIFVIANTLTTVIPPNKLFTVNLIYFLRAMPTDNGSSYKIVYRICLLKQQNIAMYGKRDNTVLPCDTFLSSAH